MDISRKSGISTRNYQKGISQLGKSLSRFNFKTSIRAKLMLMLIVVSVCAMLTIAYLSYENGRNSLSDRIFNQLTSLRSARAGQITTYFETLRKQTITLSEDVMVANALKEFKAAYGQLEQRTLPPEQEAKLNEYYQKVYLPELAKIEGNEPVSNLYLPKSKSARYLQSYYIAANPNPSGKKDQLLDAGDGSEYSKVHARYHPFFKQIIERFRYYDLFLIAPETGETVYTYFKEVDFATNLFTGPFRTSNLAEAVANAIDAKAKNYTSLVDFAPYRPSYDAPNTFISAPVFDQGQLIGILVVQIPTDEINRIMTGNQNWENDGLGKSGETYLVGPDLTMRSISRFLVEDPEAYYKLLRTNLNVPESLINKIKQYKTSILEQKVDSEGVKKALGGLTGTEILNDYRGVPVLNSHAPLKIDGLQWAILAEMDLAEVYEPVYAFQRSILVWGTLLVLAISIVAMILSGIFIKPINILIANARKIGRGDLNAVVKLPPGDEFGELAAAFNNMVGSLQEQSEIAEQKNRENEQLLHSVFPANVALRLKNQEQDIGDRIANVTILFSDITGFAKLYRSMNFEEGLVILNDIIDSFDEAAEKYGVDRIKTIGDNFIAGCGISSPKLDCAKRTLDLALEMRKILHRVNREKGFNLDVSIAINSGEVIAGVVGRKKFTYDVWGPTVSLANYILMSNLSVPGAILVPQNVRDSLADLYEFELAGYLEKSGDQPLAIWQLKSTLRKEPV